MSEYRTKSGRVLTDADIQALADEAERGYDIAPTVEETPDQSILVIRETRFMWAVYFAFIVIVAAVTFGVMELLFGGH